MPSENSLAFKVGDEYGPLIYDEGSHLEICSDYGCTEISRAEAAALMSFLARWLAGEEVIDGDEDG